MLEVNDLVSKTNTCHRGYTHTHDIYIFFLNWETVGNILYVEFRVSHKVKITVEKKNKIKKTGAREASNENSCVFFFFFQQLLRESIILLKN